MLFTETIQMKRDGRELEDSVLESAIELYTRDEIPDYQMSAFLMAVFFRGMTRREMGAWTKAMLHSGSILDWSGLGKTCVDKHSTGGVGDKISIPLAPAVAACGVPVPMISGRGLGHTGGTLDKLEAIPGFRVRIEASLARKCMEEIGVAMMGQTEEIAPADRRLYALRDATSTVESIPLIASSIMSKKLAEGIGGLVLDVKVGSGAFMKTLEDATQLAETLVYIGEYSGCHTVARLTRMDRPLGRMVGNALEIQESIDVLRGGGPSDVRDLVVALGGEMLALGGAAQTVGEGEKRIGAVLDNGQGLETFRKMVALQGGDPRVVDEPNVVLPKASYQSEVLATGSGFVSSVDTKEVGLSSLVLGAGRAQKSDTIDPAVGVEMLCKVGDRIEEGAPLCRLYHNDEAKAEQANQRVLNAIQIGMEPEDTPLFLGRITGGSNE